METIDLSPLTQAVAAIMMAIITGYVIPWLKAITEQKKQDNNKVIVETLVKAAEQVFKNEGEGQKKLEYVQTELEKRGMETNTPVIEAVVFDLTTQVAQQVETEG